MARARASLGRVTQDASTAIDEAADVATDKTAGLRTTAEGLAQDARTTMPGLSMLTAKRTVEHKRRQIEAAEAVTASCRESCELAFVALGKSKLIAMRQGLLPFHDAFSRLHGVQLQGDVNVEDAPELSAGQVAEVGRLTLSTLDSLGGLALAGAAGATATATTLTAVGALASASTGTAIGSLSGAAATNATLAWLGGGSLAAGGGGMAAGAVVLAGVAAVPAVLVGGVFLYLKGKESMAKADTFASSVDAELAKHRQAQAVLRTASELADRAHELTENLVPPLSRNTGWLETVVSQETSWDALDRTAQERIRSTALLAVTVSNLVHTPIVDDGGAVTKAVQDACEHGQLAVDGLAH